MSLAWVLFRAPSMDVALVIFRALAGVPTFFGQDGWRLIWVAAACAIVLPPSHRLAVALTREPRSPVAIGLGIVGIAILVQLGRERAYEFIYFQF